MPIGTKLLRGKALCYNKLNTRSSHRIEKKCNCNVKNLILCSCRHCNLWNYFGGVSLGNPRKLILVLLSYFLQQSSRLSFNNLQSTVYHSVYHVYGSHYCWLFRVFFSNYMTHWNSFNTISSFFHKYEFFHVSSNAVIDRASCHILSSWMVFHQYVFFHVSSNCVNRRASFHTLSRWMVFHQYEFFHASSKHSFWEFVLTLWTAEWFFNSMNSFMCHQIVWTAELLFTL